MTNSKKRAAGAGRKPRGPHHKMSESTTIRLTEATRAALNKRSEQLDLSRSQIIESALLRYFHDKEADEFALWGPPRVRAGALCLAKIIRAAETRSGADPVSDAGPSWLDDRFVFETARAGVVQFLSRLSAERVPAGEAVPTDAIKRAAQRCAAYDPGHAARMTTPEGLGGSIVHHLDAMFYFAPVVEGQSQRVWAKLVKDIFGDSKNLEQSDQPIPDPD